MELQSIFRRTAALAVAALIAWLAWWIAPSLTGQPEPWDSPWWFASLAVAAAIAPWLTARPFLPTLAGTWAGNLVGMAQFAEPGPLWLAGAVFAGVGAAAAAAAAVAARMVWQRGREHSTTAPP